MVLDSIKFVVGDVRNWTLVQEMIECGTTVDSLDPKEIAEAIEHFLDHPEIRHKMSENGRRAVWENEGKKLLELSEKLFAKAHSLSRGCSNLSLWR